MPCWRCGARQTDPARGASPWVVAVRRGEQVLVCPECRRTADWTADLDHCAACGSTRLLRRLGETSCRDCGASGIATATAEPAHPATTGGTTTTLASPVAPVAPTTLDEEVAAALERVLRPRGR